MTSPGGVIPVPDGQQLLVHLRPDECLLVRQASGDLACVRDHPAPPGGHAYVSGAVLERMLRERQEPSGS